MRPARKRRRALAIVCAAIALQWRAAPVASALTLALMIGTGSSAAIAGWLSKQAFDELARGSAMDASRALTMGVCAAAIAGCAMAVLNLLEYLGVIAHHRITLVVERALFAKALELESLRHFEDPVFHGRLRLAQQGAQEAPQQLVGFVYAAIRTVVSVGSLTIVVFVVSPLMTVLLLVAGAVGVVAKSIRGRRLAELGESLVQSYRWRDFYRALLVDGKAAKEIRLFGTGDLLLQRLVSGMNMLARREIRASRAGVVLHTGLSLMSAAVTAAGTFVVVRGAMRGELTIGDVSLFLAAVAGIQLTFTSLVMEMERLGKSIYTFDHYLQFLDQRDRPSAAQPPAPSLSRGIELRDVWFRYDADGPWVLRGVNLFIPAGATIGLVGVNGAGKSTLLKLLCRFYDQDRGEILWDGTDVRQLDVRSIRRRISATFQDFMTYDLTASENIGLGDIDHLEDTDKIRAAAGLAEIHRDLAALPAGYGTLLSRIFTHEEPSEADVALAVPARAPAARGVSLSGGQWQRVAMARSLMRAQADLVVLDEPSSGLDAEAEFNLHRTLQHHSAGRTRILISHRLSALRTADVIAVLAGGRIVEEGNHDQLMAAGAEYARLFTLQARAYQDVSVAAAGGSQGAA